MESQRQNFIRILNSNRGIIESLCKVYYSRHEDQKDAFQDIILQLWRSFDTFQGASEISTWIYRVSLNTILGKLRSEKKRVITEPLDLSNSSIPISMADGDLELLKIIIQSLKDLDKAIIILSLEGYKNKEISKILSLTPTNVSTRLNRVKTELKVKFRKHCNEFGQS